MWLACVPAQTQITVESLRAFDDTMVHPEDEEVAADEAEDEFAAIFAGDSRPKTLVTTKIQPSAYIYPFVRELLMVFPGSIFYRRGRYPLKRICLFAQQRGYTHVMVVGERGKQVASLLVVKLGDASLAPAERVRGMPPAAVTAKPDDAAEDEEDDDAAEDEEDDDAAEAEEDDDAAEDEEDDDAAEAEEDGDAAEDEEDGLGAASAAAPVKSVPHARDSAQGGPTALFRVTSATLGADIIGHGNPSKHRPEIILNNFGTRLGHRVGRLLGSLFPHDPEFRGRRVVTFHNQRDFVFVRHHRYIFDELGRRARLQELGPRFTLQLKWLQAGTFDTRLGDFEWFHRGRQMGTGRKRFHL
jgi:ribosome production factor 1